MSASPNSVPNHVINPRKVNLCSSSDESSKFNNDVTIAVISASLLFSSYPLNRLTVHYVVLVANSWKLPHL